MYILVASGQVRAYIDPLRLNGDLELANILVFPPLEKVISLPMLDLRPKDWSSSTIEKTEEEEGEERKV